jgi:phosphatidylglycerol:prolipoprotein diacylglycerol transferase
MPKGAAWRVGPPIILQALAPAEADFPISMTLDLVLDAATAAGSAVHQPLQWVDLHLKRGIELGPLTTHFGFTLRYYSLAYLAGILFGYWHLTREIKTAGAPLGQRHADDLFFWCTIGIILGGRSGYALFYDHAMLTSPTLFVRLWDGGMSFHGGLAGVIVAIAWVCRANGLSFLRVGDYIAPCAPIGLFFGRCANFINGELWGRVTTPDVAWAMVFPMAARCRATPASFTRRRWKVWCWR